MTNDRKGYHFTKDQLRVLAGIYVLPHEDRLDFMRGFFMGKPEIDILTMFSNYIDMAETVIENTREIYEDVAIAHWVVDPAAVKVNTPSILGAIKGLEMSAGLDAASFCHGCAFRKGSVANTSLITTDDAKWCADDGKTFMCHEDLDLKTGEPTRKCRGFLKSEKEKAK